MKPMKVAMPERFVEEFGLVSLSNQHRLVGKASWAAAYGPVRTVVWEGEGREAFHYPDWDRRFDRSVGHNP